MASVGLHLTPPILEAAYELLRATLPFRRWKLPPGEEVAFKVTLTSSYSGATTIAGGFRIELSAHRHGRLSHVITTMAHEMIHVYEGLHGVRSHHGAGFMRAAMLVCRYHGFDPKQFVGLGVVVQPIQGRRK